MSSGFDIQWPFHHGSVYNRKCYELPIKNATVKISLLHLLALIWPLISIWSFTAIHVCWMSLWALANPFRKKWPEHSSRHATRFLCIRKRLHWRPRTAMTERIRLKHNWLDEHLSELSRRQISYVELSFNSSVRVSSASPSPTLLLQTTDLPKQSCQTQQIMLCSILWEDAQARGCQTRFSASSKCVTFNTNNNYHSWWCAGYFFLQDKSEEQPNFCLWVLKSKHWLKSICSTTKSLLLTV